MRGDGKQLRRLGFAAVLMLAGSGAIAQGQTSTACGTPTALDDGWTIASPESVGLDSARLCAMAARLKEIQANVHAVVIVRRGRAGIRAVFFRSRRALGRCRTVRL